jgi:response regulator RpfG family c-di-GMP phosphodiesterase
MPKKNGFEVLEELKQSKDTVNIPVIILTMLGQDEEVEKGLRLGANQYVIKSQYAVTEIIDKIKDFLVHKSKTTSSQL